MMAGEQILVTFNSRVLKRYLLGVIFILLKTKQLYRREIIENLPVILLKVPSKQGKSSYQYQKIVKSHSLLRYS